MDEEKSVIQKESIFFFQLTPKYCSATLLLASFSNNTGLL
jgi:hypothetical protein